MKLEVDFSEIEQLVATKTHRQMTMSYVDSDSVKITTPLTLPLVGKKNISISLRVDKIEGNDVYLAYENGLGVDLVIMGVLKFIEMGLPEYSSMAQGLPNCRIVVHLANIKKLQSVLRIVTLKTFRFTESSVVLGMELIS